MKILFIFDSTMKVKENAFKSFGLDKKDRIYIFPLTAQNSIIDAIVKEIGNERCDIEIIQTARLINSNAERLRAEYIKFIAEIPDRIYHGGKNLKEFFAIDKHASLWWFSSVCEKNTIKSSAFNELVQFDSIVEIINKEKIKKVIFGCKSRRLKKALENHLPKGCLTFKAAPTTKPRGIREYIKLEQALPYLKHILYLLNFAMRFILKARRIKDRIGRLKRPVFSENPLLIFTYYPNFEIQAAENGIFKNKYYLNLQEALEARRQKIIWVAMDVANNNISFWESLDYTKAFIRSGHSIFFPEEFASVTIQAKAFLTILISGLKFLKLERHISKAHTFGGYNFYPILKDEWYSSFVGVDGYNGLLSYFLFKALLKKLDARKCLYYCEMLSWEKALVCARNAVKKEMPLLCYQHATVSKMLLNYFNDPNEINDNERHGLPLPDKIICNSLTTYNYMRESGWPEERLAVVEAIRYSYLKKYITRIWQKDKNIIVLAFSLDQEETRSILSLTKDALRGMEDIEIWVKPHPFSRLSEILKSSGLPNGAFQIKEESLEELLPRAKIVIAGESSASIEALAFGCVVLILDLPDKINMSPLRHLKLEMVKRIDSSDGLKKSVSDLIRNEALLPQAKIESDRVVNDYFYLNERSDLPEKFLELLK